MIKALMYKFLAYELWTTDWYIENIQRFLYLLVT